MELRLGNKYCGNVLFCIDIVSYLNIKQMAVVIDRLFKVVVIPVIPCPTHAKLAVRCTQQVKNHHLLFHEDKIASKFPTVGK